MNNKLADLGQNIPIDNFIKMDDILKNMCKNIETVKHILRISTR